MNNVRTRDTRGEKREKRVAIRETHTHTSLTIEEAEEKLDDRKIARRSFRLLGEREKHNSREKPIAILSLPTPSAQRSLSFSSTTTTRERLCV